MLTMTRKQIKTWLTQHKIVNFEITDDLVVNVNDNVDLFDRGLTSIPIRFGVVAGAFWCNYNKLSSLEHAPLFIGENFWCNNNRLTSLLHAPVYVGGNFYCHNNSKRFELSDLPKETILNRLNREFIC